MKGRHHLEGSTLIGEDPSFYLCRCGAEFELYSHYKSHQSREHSAFGVQKHLYAQNTDLVSLQTSSSQQQRSNTVDGKVQSETDLDEQAQNRNPNMNHQLRDKDQSKQKVLQHDSNRFSRTAENKQEETINWNGLILTRNKCCNINPYFCGNCQIILFDIKLFIIHCMNNCQNLAHKDSSHFISFNYELDTKENISQNTAKEKILDHNKLPPLLSDGLLINEIDFQSFKELIRKRLDHRNLDFYCGHCQKSFINAYSYYSHKANHHVRSIEDSSSHVILRFYTGRAYFLYISPKVAWIHQERKYFCSCQPQSKLKMEELIKHIIQVHSWVSPFYHISNYDKRKHLQANQEILSTGQILQPRIIQSQVINRYQQAQIKEEEYADLEAEQHCYQSIYEVYLDCQDHRNLPFYCGKCKISFKQARYYRSHIIYDHRNEVDVSSSHVILRLCNKTNNLNLYLSPKAEWPHNQIIYLCPCDINAKMKMSTLIQHLFDKHHGISPLYLLKGNIIRYRVGQRKYNYITDPMNYILRRVEDHRNLTFRCEPCQLELLNSTIYKNHINEVHDNKIHPTSSHIIFRTAGARPKIRQYIYVSQHVEWNVAQQEKYYCPCLPEDKMFMKNLIKHVIQVHHGVSPIYSIPSFQRKNQDMVTREINIMQQVSIQRQTNLCKRKRSADPIWQMYINRIDDKDTIHFKCEACERIFDLKTTYNMHFYRIRHQNVQNLVCSHVIFRIERSPSKKFNIYISSSAEWDHNNEVYYCPCEPEKRVNMRDLLQHHAKVHKYISPLYIFNAKAQK